jgi:hypothetical protein
MEPKLVLGGVIPANLMAFDANLESTKEITVGIFAT